ncbi:unnamed protein product [Taenia asiatica]|uniref:DUF503 domain-containing protein n=1 Tax=Taenia asiatica TaxID=60517 RepID=A0A0R3W702_TAEAS|nr:unnamed protein product [Taenia asiatica]
MVPVWATGRVAFGRLFRTGGLMSELTEKDLNMICGKLGRHRWTNGFSDVGLAREARFRGRVLTEVISHFLTDSTDINGVRYHLQRNCCVLAARAEDDTLARLDELTFARVQKTHRLNPLEVLPCC